MLSVAAFVAMMCCWCAFPTIVKTQETNCPYFQYLNYDTTYIGRITVPITQSVTDLNVQFSQRGLIPTNYYGSLTLYDDEETTKNNIRNGQPISYRVNFPTVGELPRLVSLQLNGVVICSGSTFPPPNTMINLTHTLRSTNTLYTPFNNALPVSTFNYETLRQPEGQLAIIQEVQPVRSRIASPILDLEPSFFEPNTEQSPTNTETPTVTIRSQLERQRQNTTMTPTTLVRLSPSSPAIHSKLTRVTSENSQCGNEGNTIALVHGGVEISRGRYPWLAAIYHKESKYVNFKCGGSLVSQLIVITAAHCVHGKHEHEIIVWLGRHDLNIEHEKGTVEQYVQSIRMHYEYNVGLMSDADIAMLTLESPVSYSLFIKPICIWSVDEPIALQPKERGLVAGWGMDELGNEMTRYPKSVEETIVDEVTCIRSLLAPDITTNRTLCAGNKDGTGPCMGDSGGGLMIKRNGHWLLRGIVSQGLTIPGRQQCNLREYVVYCDLAKHIDWVLQGLK